MSVSNPSHAARCTCNNCRYDDSMRALAKLHLYRVDEGGEHSAWPGVNSDDAIRRHVAAYAKYAGEPLDPSECSATQYADDEVIRVGGDDPEEDIPFGGHFDACDQRAVATAEQWAVHANRTGQSAFGSVY